MHRGGRQAGPGARGADVGASESRCDGRRSERGPVRGGGRPGQAPVHGSLKGAGARCAAGGVGRKGQQGPVHRQPHAGGRSPRFSGMGAGAVGAARGTGEGGAAGALPPLGASPVERGLPRL